MRRILGTLLLAAVAAPPIASLVLTERGLRAAQALPPALCLEQQVRAQIAAGEFAMKREDVLVAHAANFALGSSVGPWWHVRGAAIAWTYATFWPRGRRSEIFEQIASRMLPCPPRPRRRA